MMKIGNLKPSLVFFLVLLLSLIPAADADCTGEITYYGATIVNGDTLEVGVNFKNTGTEFCDFRVFLLKSNGDKVDKEPDVGWSSTPVGEEGSETVSGSLSKFSDGTYNIELRDQHAGVVDTGAGTISTADICAGEIVDVIAATKKVPLAYGPGATPMYIDTLEVELYFKNTGTTGCEFKVFLLNGDGDTVDEAPNTYWGNFDIGEIGSYKTSGPLSQFGDDSYTIQLKDQSAGKVDEETGSISTTAIPEFPEEFIVSSDTCSCHGESLTASGSSLSMAEYQCGSVCGGLTYCGKGGADCDSCCSSYCSGAGLDSTSGVSGCTNQCTNSCGSNRFVHDLTDLFVAIALIVAALAFAACGIKFITSDEPGSRRQAKKCIIYVIAALVLLGLAGAMVGVFYEPTVQNCMDNDNDGYNGYNSFSCTSGDDCNDGNDAVNPGATEDCDNGVDDDCDGRTDCDDSDCSSYPACNQPPTANAGPDKTVTKGASFSIDGSASSDPNGDSLTYTWSDSKGEPIPGGASPSVTFNTPGGHTVTLTVNDGKGGTDTDTVTITVGGVAASVGVAISGLEYGEYNV